MKIRLLAKYRFFNPYLLIQRSISFGRIRLNEIKPAKVRLHNENYLDSLNTNPFNYKGSKYKGFLNKLFLSFVFAVPVIYAEEQKQKKVNNEEKIFISYNHSSKVFVKKFVDKLKKEGIKEENIWFDEKDIHVGDELSKKIEEGILASSFFIAFISNKYIRSTNCRKEFGYAEKKNKKCFNLVTENLDLLGTGFDFHLNNDELRLDLYKINKNDDEKIDEIFNKLKPQFNKIGSSNSKTNNESINTRSENSQITEIINIEITANEHFIERKNLFEEINSRLSSDNKTVLLYGIPGVGKTSCAIEYILKKKKKKDISNYFYFNSDQVFKIQNSIISFCEQLNLTKPEDSIDTKIESFKNYLKKTNDKIILFFDNVEDFDALKKKIDYKEINKPTILTSTFKLKNEKDFIEIKTFNQEESKNFLKLKLDHLNNDELESIVKHISENDECLTYKLVMIASLMLNDDTLTESELIKMNIKDEYMTQLLTRIESKSKDAIKILKYLCFLNPDEIPDELMKKIPMESNLKDVVSLLVKYNLCRRINLNSPNVGVSIHRLLNKQIQSCSFENNNSEKEVIEKDLINLLDKLFIEVDSTSIDEWKKAQILYSNIRYILSKYEAETDQIGNLYIKLSAYERHVKFDYQQCLNDGLKALKIFENIYKGDHKKISNLLNNIGNTYDDMKQNEKALEYHVESLEMRKRLFKTDHPDIAASLNNIGNAYINMKQNEKALEYHVESLEMRKRLFKTDHPDIASSLNNIGVAYSDMKQYEKALEYYLESLEMRKRLFKTDHPDIARSLNNIGNAYINMKQYEKALEYHVESLKMMKRLFKTDHPDIARSLNNIGNAYKNMKQYEMASKYYLQSSEMRKRLFKSDSRDFS
jgi:tetratricopeptide (TPR) repeat protein